jgi:hypothetical protein
MAIRYASRKVVRGIHKHVWYFPKALSHVMLRCNMTLDDHKLPEDPPSSSAAMADDRPSTPPRVYRAPDVDDWIVEPPGDRASDEGTMVFKGARAQHEALTYAHAKFGNARFFPY